ncbi:MAG TPA: isoprenyl transferase, partial [Symbiobacteriaceae bacterium]|nr:isoprenyl transferase [Symbiobacteriaceae bacterium]
MALSLSKFMTGNTQPVPSAKRARHVGIIMDGNGRWATRRGMPRSMGHRAGVEALRRTIEAAPSVGIEVLTVFAFSTENWKRPKPEVDFIMNLLVEYCRREIDKLNEAGVRLNALGRIDEMPEPQRSEIRRAVELTAGNDRLTVNLAVNYGGRAELVDAFKAMAVKLQAGELDPSAIDEALLGEHLYTKGLPDIDMVIRTAGEMRLSNFLLWQSSYSEIYVSDIAWPDFNGEHLARALESFGRRERRFGGLVEE